MNGIQVKCANNQLIDASDVDDVGFLTYVLLISLLKENLISGGKLNLSGEKTMTFDRVKEVYDKRGGIRLLRQLKK